MSATAAEDSQAVIPVYHNRQHSAVCLHTLRDAARFPTFAKLSRAEVAPLASAPAPEFTPGVQWGSTGGRTTQHIGRVRVLLEFW